MMGVCTPCVLTQGRSIHATVPARSPSRAPPVLIQHLASSGSGHMTTISTPSAYKSVRYTYPRSATQDASVTWLLHLPLYTFFSLSTFLSLCTFFLLCPVQDKTIVHRVFPGGGSCFSSPCINSLTGALQCATLEGRVVAVDLVRCHHRTMCYAIQTVCLCCHGNSR